MNNDKLPKLYKNRFAKNELHRKNEIWQVICHNYLSMFINPSDTVVDISCGYGEFINNIRANRKIAVDLNTDTKDFLDPTIEFHQCSATEIGSIINNQADIIFTSNFLEHLPDKKTLDIFLDNVLLALKSGGKYIILGPNIRYLPGEYWDFYDHHLALTHLSLSEALKLKGFSIEVCLDRFLPYRTQGILPTHPLLVSTYLKFPLIWRFLGKQFFIVAKKSESTFTTRLK